jgi:cell filamentation protein
MSLNDDPYVYPETTTLKNKANIKDKGKAQEFENISSSIRINELNSNPIKGNFDYQHLQDIHKHIFQDVYEWAGEPRTIKMGKKEAVLDNLSVAYPDPDNPFPPDNMASRAEYAFSELKKDNLLKNLPEDKFVQKLAKHASEIWEVHAFREGNTRTVVSFMEQLSKEAGHQMKLGINDTGKEVRDAFVHSSAGNSESIEKLIRSGITGDRGDIEYKGSNEYQKIKTVGYDYLSKSIKNPEQLKQAQMMMNKELIDRDKNNNLPKIEQSRDFDASKSHDHDEPER